MLTDDEVLEFKKIVFESYGIQLNDSEARDQAERIIRLFELMIRRKKQLEGNLILN